MRRQLLAAAVLLLAPLAAQQEPQAAYDALVRSFQQAMADWMAQQQAAAEQAKQAEAEGRPVPALSMVPPTKAFVAEAQRLAASYQGKDDAVRFLAFVVKNASNERTAVRQAVETLARDHARSHAIADVVPALGLALRLARKPTMALLDEVAANHASTETRAQALLVRGEARVQANDDAERQAGAQDLRRVAELSKDEDLLAAAKDALFEFEHLQVGCTAPEIEGVDTDGAPMKLSDYRGKVILLDFWGFW